MRPARLREGTVGAHGAAEITAVDYSSNSESQSDGKLAQISVLVLVVSSKGGFRMTRYGVM